MLAQLFDSIFTLAKKRIGTPVLMVAIDPQTDGSFNTLYDTHGMTRGHVEAAALDLLRHLDADLGDCPDCAACKARSERVTLAIAALTGDLIMQDVH